MIPLPPAPGAEARTSLALVNSHVSLPGGRSADELDSPAAATQWLIERDLVPADAALLEYCQSELAGLRETLRELFAAQVAGAAPSAEVLDGVNRALTRVPSAQLLQHDADRGLHRASAHPVTRLVEHAMAQIAEDAAALLTGDAAGSIARCTAPPCDRFLLRTHARRHWCSTRCGDRVRASRAYARKQESARGQGESPEGTSRRGDEESSGGIDRDLPKFR
ncbi:CGNR zinc finger domain-containing protein [Brachybacterium paraconglomeratum]|uniref:CGNR zinc finger domain-containing protein n=1 Tax=Brachybacterium paraconglomeratum TaxID=173362 RepID=UPI0031ED5FCB